MTFVVTKNAQVTNMANITPNATRMDATFILTLKSHLNVAFVYSVVKNSDGAMKRHGIECLEMSSVNMMRMRGDDEELFAYFPVSTMRGDSFHLF